MANIIFALLSFFLFVFTPIASVQAEDVPDTVRIIRVGLVEPLGQKNEFAYRMILDYLRSYLEEISKQNHWQYSYTQGSFAECREKLLRGELDLVAPVQSIPDGQDIAYTADFSCYTLLRLYRRSDEPRRPMTPETVNGVVIGMLENEDNEEALAYFLSKNDWHASIRKFQSAEAMLSALHQRELDAVCDDGSHVTENERHARAFAVVAAQFMTARGREDLSRSLTDAIMNIDTTTPIFESRMKTAYVDRAIQSIVRPTESEHQFIENSQELRVAFLPSFLPFYDAKGTLEESDGLYIDLLKLLSNVSGIRFSPVQAASEEALWQMLYTGEADLAFVAYVNGRAPLEMYFTGDFRTEEYAVVRRRDGRTDTYGKNVAAIPESFPGASQYIERQLHWRTRLFPSVKECLDAVAAGAYEAAVIPSMYLRREDSLVLRSDLEAVNESEISIPISFAISPKQPHILQNVLNTALLRMNQAEISRLAQENATPLFSINYLFRRYPLQMALILCVLLIGGAATLFILYHSRLQKKQNRLLQQKNRELETALANVEAMRVSRDNYKLDSETDKLTNTFNKAGFERLAREQLDTLGGNGAALYMIDLDHFKEANDTYGHKCGDEILQKFATALKCVFRQSDYVGRFGGDEFVVLIEGTLTQEVVGRKALQILEAARTIAIEGKDVRISASVGVAIVPNHGKSYEELFQVADKALYKVKSEGRNGYSIASEDIQR